MYFCRLFSDNRINIQIRCRFQSTSSHPFFYFYLLTTTIVVCILFRADHIVICQIGGTTSCSTSGSCPPSSNRALESILKTGIECQLLQMVARVSIIGQRGRLAHVSPCSRHLYCKFFSAMNYLTKLMDKISEQERLIEKQLAKYGILSSTAL